MLTDDLADLLGPPTVPGIHESELADLLGITSQRVRALTRDGLLRRVAPARYDMRESVRAYCENLREKAARAGRTPATGADDLKAEKLRLARAQADALDLKNAALRRELLPAAEVARDWANVLRTVRGALLAFSSRVGARLGHLTAHDLSEIDHEVRAALTELAGASDAS